MIPRHAWRNVDPTQFNDGVLYLPAMVEIQPKQPDWGLPDMLGLLTKVNEDRPHGGDENNGKLLCLKCMAIKARAGEVVAPVWMYFQQRNGLRLFCHIGTDQVHAEHMPESDEHRALVEREVRTCERVGASVDTEVVAANGRRRADFIAVGPEVTLAGEIQRSLESSRRISQRQRDLTRDGKRALWTTDSIRPGFLNGVPRLVIPNLSGWQQALRDPELAIVAGLTLIEYQRCGWADTWSGTTRCPHTGLLRPCGRVHAYPTPNVNTRTYRRTGDRVMQIGMGRRPHLDYVVGGIVMGEWLPYERKVKAQRQFVWMPTEDYHRFVEDRGGEDPRVAERNAGLDRQSTESAERTCEYRTNGRRSTTIIDMKPAQPNTPSVVLDWRSYAVNDLQPCQHCGQPAFCRDGRGLPTHKVCAERFMGGYSS